MPDLRARLESLLGPGAVRAGDTAAAGLTLDGVRVAVGIRPPGEAELAAALRALAELGARVAVMGRGSKQTWGGPLQGADVVISTEGLGHHPVHDADDLVASAPAGMAWRAFQDLLGRAGQWIPLDPPLADQATVGGVVAAATSGPRRLAYGGVRDLVIGARAVLADGRIIRAGGRVIKNVAGYDLCKLLVGSLGSLAVLTDVTWKVAPLPEAWGCVTVTCRDAGEAVDLGLSVLRSVLQPAAVQVLWPAPGGDGPPRLRVDVDGLEPVVRRQLRDLAALVRGEVQGPHAVRGARDLEHACRAAPRVDSGWTVVRVGVPAARLAEAVAAARRLLAPGTASPLRADVAAGLLWCTVPAAGDPARLAADVCRLNAAVQPAGGYAVVESGPHEVRARWASLRAERRVPGSALSARLKAIFDPSGLLNPGRLVL